MDLWHADLSENTNYDQGLIPSSRGFKREQQSFPGRLIVSDSYSPEVLIDRSLAVAESWFQAADQSLRRRRTLLMESNSTGSVQYDRWNEDNINMNVEASQSASMSIYNRVCNGSWGVAVKAAGALAALVSVYVIGYVTGYYVHRV